MLFSLNVELRPEVYTNRITAAVMVAHIAGAPFALPLSPEGPG
jgi:hypothetical protein